MWRTFVKIERLGVSRTQRFQRCGYLKWNVELFAEKAFSIFASKIWVTVVKPGEAFVMRSR